MVVGNSVFVVRVPVITWLSLYVSLYKLFELQGPRVRLLRASCKMELRVAMVVKRTEDDDERIPRANLNPGPLDRKRVPEFETSVPPLRLDLIW